MEKKLYWEKALGDESEEIRYSAIDYLRDNNLAE